MAKRVENAEADLAPMVRNLINALWNEWKTVEQQIGELSEELEPISAAMPAAHAFGRSQV
jgi:hypothetical protein